MLHYMKKQNMPFRHSTNAERPTIKKYSLPYPCPRKGLILSDEPTGSPYIWRQIEVMKIIRSLVCKLAVLQ